MNHAEPLCVPRDALDASALDPLSKFAWVIALTLAMVAASGEVGAVSSDLDQKPSGRGAVSDPSLSRAGIAIETKVFRVAEDGVLEALELEPDPSADEAKAETAADATAFGAPQIPDRQQPQDSSEGLALTDLPMPAGTQGASLAEASFTGADVADSTIETDLEADVKGWQDEVLEANISNRVVAGDRLRYEVIVRNTNDFTVPALALEVIERLPKDTQLVTEEKQLTNEMAKGWLVAAQPALTEQRVGGEEAQLKGTYQADLYQPPALHWSNAQALLPQHQMVLVYEVIVVSQSTPPATASEDSGNGLDSSQTQLQLPE
jgi:hypothetical protein